MSAMHKRHLRQPGWLYAGAVGDQFILIEDNAHPLRARVVQDYLDMEFFFERMDRPARSTQNHPGAWSHVGPRMGSHTRENDQKPNKEYEKALQSCH
jgi:hypothetical protein